jgi:hypothetical protein
VAGGKRRDKNRKARSEAEKGGQGKGCLLPLASAVGLFLCNPRDVIAWQQNASPSTPGGGIANVCKENPEAKKAEASGRARKDGKNYALRVTKIAIKE